MYILYLAYCSGLKPTRKYRRGLVYNNMYSLSHGRGFIFRTLYIIYTIHIYRIVSDCCLNQ